MDSTTIKTKNTMSDPLDSTLELPVLEAIANQKIDIHLPNIRKSWQGPVLQAGDYHQPLIASLDDDLDDDIPQVGMFRAVNPTLGKAKAHVIVDDSTAGVRSYARRSTKRGRVYTVLFLALLLAGVAWMYFNLETYLVALLSNLP